MPKGYKLTTEEVIEQFKKVHGSRYDYSKVDYKNGRSKITIICPVHGEFEQMAQSHKTGSGCSKCANENKRLSHNDYVHKLQKSQHTNLQAIEKYKINNVPILHMCLDCGSKFKSSPHSILVKKTGCSFCYHSRNRFTQEEYKNKLRNKTEGKICNIEPYKNIKTKIKHKCLICGNIWKSKPHNILVCNTGCPECAVNLISEPLFREVLETIVSRFGNFRFSNVRPNWLKNPETGYKLELDCYNEKLKLAFELQGIQHYEPIEFWGGEAKFAKTIRRDNHKLTECRKRGVQLFRIDNRPVSSKSLQAKREYYENEIRKCLTKLPEDVKLKLLNANK